MLLGRELEKFNAVHDSLRKNLGKYSNGLVLRAIGGKMPGGLNITGAISYLLEAWAGTPTRRRSATHCYHQGARQAPSFRSRG